ncbi:MAG: hypothetical protein ACK5N9_07810 [Pirellula sp.]|jgi:hypothetical protein
MELSDLTPEQLGKILFRVTQQSRKAAKRYLHDLGCPADSESLDAAIELANRSDEAKRASESIKAYREEIGTGLDAASRIERQRVLDRLRERIDSLDGGHVEFASSIGWDPLYLSNMLNGRTTMSLIDLCRLAVAMGEKINIGK